MLKIPQCINCIHYQKRVDIGHYRCDAFEQIPREIILNEVIHDEPYPGDNGIQFEPKEEL